MRTIDWQETEFLVREERLAYAGPTSLRTRSTEEWLSSVWPRSVSKMRHQSVPDSQRADTTLIPPGTQYCATRSKAGKGNPSKYAAFAILCTPLQHLSDHS
jgi:hypothetical protein